MRIGSLDILLGHHGASMHCDETLLILVDPHCTVIPHLHGYATVAAACAHARSNEWGIFVCRARVVFHRDDVHRRRGGPFHASRRRVGPMWRVYCSDNGFKILPRNSTTS